MLLSLEKSHSVIPQDFNFLWNLNYDLLNNLMMSGFNYQKFSY